MSRKLRVFIFSTDRCDKSVDSLKSFVLNTGSAVRVSHALQELADVVTNPASDFGLVVILNSTGKKISSSMPQTRFKILEFLPNRCSVTKMIELIEAEAKVLGRY